VFVLTQTAVRLGTDAGVVHFISTARGRGDGPQTLTDAIWASAVPVGIGAVIGGAVVAAITPTLVHAVAAGVPAVHPRDLAGVVAIGIPVAAGYDLLTAATRGLGSARPTVVVERFVRPALQVGATGAALGAGAGAFGLVTAWVAPYAVVAPVMLGWTAVMLRRLGAPLRSPVWPVVFPSVWRFTLPRSITGVLQILLQRLDIVIVGAILGSAPAAVYTGATRFLVVGQLGNQAISFAFQPQLARLIARGEIEPAKSLFKTSTAWVLGVNAPLYLAVCSTAPLLIKLFGHSYGSGTATMVVVSAAGLAGAACGLVDYVLITVGRTTWNLANSAVALVLNVAIDVALVPHVGIIGAAVGWAASIVAGNALPLWQVHRSFGFSPVSTLWAKLLVAAVLGFGAAPALTLWLSHRSWPAVAGVVVAAGASYAGFLWRSREEFGLSFATLRRAPT
jgi:O-antigen/teichoic acid export membrane protein